MSQTTAFVLLVLVLVGWWLAVDILKMGQKKDGK